MASAITVRQIDPQLHEALRLRAARSGRSVESEIRAILSEACLPETPQNWLSGIRARAIARTGGKKQTDSATLIREARDVR
jgi:plasmid stability protein